MTERPELMRHPLADRIDAMATAGAAGQVMLRDPGFTGQIDLRGDAADAGFADAVRQALGFALPTAPNTVSGGGERAALSLSPDEWLIVVPFDARAETFRTLRDALAGRHVSVTDVSANRVVFELAGPKAREVIAKGCGLDLHPRSFGPGRCAQTVLARSQALVWQTDETPTFRLLVRPSFAGYVADFLVDAMKEYALPAIPA